MSNFGDKTAAYTTPYSVQYNPTDEYYRQQQYSTQQYGQTQPVINFISFEHLFLAFYYVVVFFWYNAYYVIEFISTLD